MIALKRLDRLVGQLQCVDLRELVAEKIDLIGRQFRFAGDPVAFGEKFAPRAVTRPVGDGGLPGPAEKIEQLQLAALLEEAPRLARPVKIDPVLAEALQCGERREAAVDRDLRRLFARQAALEDQPAVLARRQVEFLQQRIHPLRVLEIQSGLDLRRRRALADDGLVRALAGQQAQSPEQDALARAGFAGHRGEPRLEVERHFFQQSEVLDPERLKHPASAHEMAAAFKRLIFTFRIHHRLEPAIDANAYPSAAAWLTRLRRQAKPAPFFSTAFCLREPCLTVLIPPSKFCGPLAQLVRAFP